MRTRTHGIARKLGHWGRGYVSCSPAACFALLSLVRACGILPSLSATLWKSPKAPKAARALAFYVSGAELGRSLMMPPGVPVDRVKVLCVAFRAMIEDPELLAEIAKSGQEFQPASDEQVEKLVREVASAPRDIVERVAAILRVQ